MRIHTNTLSREDIFLAARNLGLHPEVLTEHGSRKRTKGFEVQLSGTSTHKAQSGEWNAATWDEWGAFLGRLFILDKDMTTSYYDSREAFHRITRNRFQSGHIPADTHGQHKWVYSFEKSRPFSGISISYCNKCTAEMRR